MDWVTAELISPGFLLVLTLMYTLKGPGSYQRCGIFPVKWNKVPYEAFVSSSVYCMGEFLLPQKSISGIKITFIFLIKKKSESVIFPMHYAKKILAYTDPFAFVLLENIWVNMVTTF